jgi:protein gp37
MEVRYKRVEWGSGKPRVRTSPENWRKVENLNDKARLQEIKPAVFAMSLADWLDDEVPIEWLADFMALLPYTPHLRWLLLTKRPQNYRRRVSDAFEWLAKNRDLKVVAKLADMLPGAGVAGLPNVAVGVTAEDQQRLDERVPYLEQIPAAMRFVSVEPIIEDVDLHLELTPKIDWVIVGGESGAGCRETQVEHLASIVHQCQNTAVACFVKQMGAKPLAQGFRLRVKGKGGDFERFPPELQVRQWPKWLESVS